MEVASPAGWMVMHSSGRFFKKVEESFMERLNYEVLKKSGYDGYVLKNAPEKVLQFGEGNFLRAFVDYWFDLANEKAGWNGKCCLVQPIAPGLANMINDQEGLYTPVSARQRKRPEGGCKARDLQREPLLKPL